MNYVPETLTSYSPPCYSDLYADISICIAPTLKKYFLMIRASTQHLQEVNMCLCNSEAEPGRYDTHRTALLHTYSL